MARVRESSTQIEAKLVAAARRDAKALKELELFSRKVHRYWRRIAPVGDPTGQRYLSSTWTYLKPDTTAGSYKAGIVLRRKKVNGWPVRVIAATDHKSHWIEYGTGGDTPTPEFACRQRTATRFGAMGGVNARKGMVDKKRRVGVTSIGINAPMGKVARRGQGYETAPTQGAA